MYYNCADFEILSIKSMSVFKLAECTINFPAKKKKNMPLTRLEVICICIVNTRESTTHCFPLVSFGI